MTKILEESHFAYLSTTDQDNQPRIAPMFFVFDEKTQDVLLFTHSSSKKLKNMRVNPKVCLTVDVRDPQNPFENRGVMVQGDAVIERAADSFSVVQNKELMRIYKEFSIKYPVLGRAEAETSTRPKYEEFTEELVRVRARKMVYWKGPNFVTVNFDYKP